MCRYLQKVSAAQPACINLRCLLLCVQLFALSSLQTGGQLTFSALGQVHQLMQVLVKIAGDYLEPGPLNF